MKHATALKRAYQWLRSLLPPHVVKREGSIIYFNRPLNMREINSLARRGRL